LIVFIERMTRAVLVAGATPSSSDGSVALYVPGGEEKLGRSMLAAAGVSDVKIVSRDAADVILILSGTPAKATRPYAVSYKKSVVRALIPSGRILVGSMSQLMPDVDWTTDPGGMVIEFPGPKTGKDPNQGAWPVSARARRDAAAGGPVVIKVNDLPAKPIGFRGPVMRVLLREKRLRGVPVRDGDVVIDGAGRRWFVGDNHLWSHREAWVDKTSVTRENNRIRPMRARNGLMPSHIPFAVGDNLELTLKGGGTVGSEMVYGVIRELDAASWVVEQTKGLNLISDAEATCFGHRDAVNAADCVSRGGVWDVPCRTDTECPFFDSARGRGGCNYGTCEMPLGVANKTFRSADPATPPLCYNDGPDPFCK
jgi:hypothetical protein